MKIFESLFDVIYLSVLVALGVRLLLEKTKGANLFGIMAIVLGLGDGFHLLPRVISHLSPGGFVTIYICPIVGIIGIVFSLIEKSVARALLNFLLVLSFPILMLMGHLFIK